MIYMVGWAIGLGAALYCRAKENGQRREPTYQGRPEAPLIACYGHSWPQIKASLERMQQAADALRAIDKAKLPDKP